jgi:hypothetical protein
MFWPQKCMLGKKRKMDERAENARSCLNAFLILPIVVPEWLRLADTAVATDLFYLPGPFK